jgi:prefoldin subunit 5
LLSNEKNYYKQTENLQGDVLNAVTQKISAYNRQIEQLNQQKERFNLNKKYTQDLDELNQIKQTINGLKTQIVSLTMKQSLILESQAELDKASPNIENNKVKLIYPKLKNFCLIFRNVLKIYYHFTIV